MSVLCCYIPDFLIRLHRQRDPSLIGRPFALLDEDNRVLAVSPEASVYGVIGRMGAGQAQMRCPDIRLRKVDSMQCQVEQQTFLQILQTWELPVESFDWGAAYVGLHILTNQRKEVVLLCQELGRRLRAQLSQPLQPALGWASSKFTAQVAARSTKPGHIKLVDKAEEKGFLRPLPLSMLPLDPQALQSLHWLGIDTLGKFGALPESAVWERFGEAGKLARCWAEGKDNRPVRTPPTESFPLLLLDFTPPEEQLLLIENGLVNALHPTLKRLRNSLQSVRRLRVKLCFADGSQQTMDQTFVEGMCQDERLAKAVTRRLTALIWPEALSQIQVRLLEVSEQAIQQQMLFPLLMEEEAPLDLFAKKLRGRYGEIFYKGAVADGSHPLSQRRSHFAPLLLP